MNCSILVEVANSVDVWILAVLVDFVEFKDLLELMSSEYQRFVLMRKAKTRCLRQNCIELVLSAREL